MNRKGKPDSYRRSPEHYKRLTELRIKNLKATFPTRFWNRVDKRGPNECWLWTAFKNKCIGGYGILYQGRTLLAHRVAWTLSKGAIPRGLFVLHRCDNPPCCNPSHLFLGTHLDNIKDMVQKGRNAKPSLGKFGESACHVKPTEDQAKEIIQRYTPGRPHHPGNKLSLAHEFRVSGSAIEQVVYGATWPHLKR